MTKHEWGYVAIFAVIIAALYGAFDLIIGQSKLIEVANQRIATLEARTSDRWKRSDHDCFAEHLGEMNPGLNIPKWECGEGEIE